MTPLSQIIAFLHRLAAGEFFGSITLKLERGVVVSIKTEQTIKPDELEQVKVAR